MKLLQEFLQSRKQIMPEFPETSEYEVSFPLTVQLVSSLLL